MIALGMFVGSVELKVEELSRAELEEACQACHALVLQVMARLREEQITTMRQDGTGLAAWSRQQQAALMLTSWLQPLVSGASWSRQQQQAAWAASQAHQAVEGEKR